jgi:hypothetical protein
VKKQHLANKYGWAETDPADEDCSQRNEDNKANQTTIGSGYSIYYEGVCN